MLLMVFMVMSNYTAYITSVILQFLKNTALFAVIETMLRMRL